MTVPEIIHRCLSEEFAARRAAANRPSIPHYFIIPDDDPQLADFFRARDIPFLTGSPHDLLERYFTTASALPRRPEIIIRLTADNPFHDLAYLDLLAEGMGPPARPDYHALTGLLLGTAGEAFRHDTLGRLRGEFGPRLAPSDREHVTLFIKHNRNLFHFRLEEAPQSPRSLLPRTDYEKIRLTLDYPSDLDMLRAVTPLIRNPLNVSNREIMELFRSHPEVFEINTGNEQRRF